MAIVNVQAPPENDTGWVELASSVAPSNQPVYIRRVGSRVTIQIKGWCNIASLILPMQYRPSEIVYCPACGFDGTDVIFDRLTIMTDGTLSLRISQMMIGQITWDLI